MTQSESIKNLAAALAKAQATAMSAIKDALNPHFNRKYADLTSVWDACRKPLADNGLSVSQLAESLDGEKVGVTTVLMHTSGEFLSSTLVLKPQKTDPQGAGSAVTYARRYGLAAIVGVVTEDDDGNGASAPPAQRPVAPRQTEPQPTPPPAKPMAAVAQAVSANVTKGEIAKKLKAWSGVNAEDVKAAAATVKRALGIDGEPDAAGLKRMAEFIDKAQQDGLVFTDWAKGVK